MKIGFVEIDIEELDKTASHYFINYDRFRPHEKEMIEGYDNLERYWRVHSVKLIELDIMLERFKKNEFWSPFEYQHYQKINKELHDESKLRALRFQSTW